MNMVWIVVGLGISSVVAAIVRSHGRARQADLGFVSNQWVAEHRLSQQHDSPR